MRKLTVLLLSGALLVITGGASVARGGEFAIIECFPTWLPPPAPGYHVTKIDTSFETPEECVGEAFKPVGIKSCSKCVAVIIQSGNLQLADSKLGRPGLEQFYIQMIFAEDDDDKDKHKRKDRDDDDDDKDRHKHKDKHRDDD